MRRQVYIVDDDAHVRRSTCFLLAAHDYECRPFDDGTSFLAEIETLAPGCVLLDLVMPGSSGFQVQVAIEPYRGRLQVIAMSGHINRESSQHALDLGAIEVLAKPFAEEVLLAALGRGFAKLEAAPAC